MTILRKENRKQLPDFNFKDNQALLLSDLSIDLMYFNN